ncbi:hypothetical protein H1R20_g8090, partial [Candolleomyces eurysporus]
MSVDPNQSFRKRYNDLRLVDQASRDFTNRDYWFEQIGKLLQEKDKSHRYALNLVHRHFELRDEERMVATDCTTKPEPVLNTVKPDVHPSSWSSDKWEYEWQRGAKLEPLPLVDDDLFSAFEKLFGQDEKIGEVLGLALRPTELDGDNLWWEVADNNNRELTISPKKRPERTDENTFETCWIPKTVGEVVDGMKVVMECCGVCTWGNH